MARKTAQQVLASTIEYWKNSSSSHQAMRAVRRLNDMGYAIVTKSDLQRLQRAEVKLQQLNGAKTKKAAKK